jgi:protein phosphatase
MSILQDRARVICGSLPRSGRTLVISDIHADLDLLDTLLKQAAYQPGQDRLIILGDFVLKGKQNLATLERVRELAALPNVTVLRGNCDDILEIIARNYPSSGMENFLRRSGFCKEVWARAGLTEWAHLPTRQLLQILDDTIPDLLHFVHSLPDILVTEDFIFVHGGLYDGRQTDLEGLDSFDCRKCDDFLGKGFSFEKYIVTGHWPVTSYPQPYADHNPLVDRARRIISIDGGCSVQRGGQLNALIIENGDPENLHSIFADRLPRVRALGAQESNLSQARMYWGNDAVDVLEWQETFCRVRQQSTGVEFLCPRVLLYQDGQGAYRTGDLSNLTLDVRPGTELAVIAESGERLYCKKDGVEGWYCGPYAPISP